MSIPSAMLFGGMLVGANALQRAAQVPSALVIALNGLIVVFVVSSEMFTKRYQQNRMNRNQQANADLSDSKSATPGAPHG
jgi:simple sugar transport system permease protein